VEHPGRGRSGLDARSVGARAIVAAPVERPHLCTSPAALDRAVARAPARRPAPSAAR
jgi:hypothetical protein